MIKVFTVSNVSEWFAVQCTAGISFFCNVISFSNYNLPVFSYRLLLSVVNNMGWWAYSLHITFI